MKIVLVEDNKGFGERLYSALSRLGSVWWLISEREFREAEEMITKDPPDVLVVDTMLRWDFPRPDTTKVPDDATDLYTAGIRCAQRLAQCPLTADLPVILYTVFEEAELRKKAVFPPNVQYLQKTSETVGIIEVVRNAVARAVTTRRADPSTVSS